MLKLCFLIAVSQTEYLRVGHLSSVSKPDGSFDDASQLPVSTIYLLWGQKLLANWLIDVSTSWKIEKGTLYFILSSKIEWPSCLEYHTLIE